MYISDDAKIVRYIEMNDNKKILIDYWLHLHARSSSNFLSARPMTYKMLSELGRCDPRVDKVLLNLLFDFAKRNQNYDDFLEKTPNVKLLENSRKINKEWIDWSDRISNVDDDNYVHKLIEEIPDDDRFEDTNKLLYCCRRISAEFSSRSIPLETIFEISLDRVFEKNSSIREMMFFIENKENYKNYNVKLYFDEENINGKIKAHDCIDAIIYKNEATKNDQYKLQAMNFDVKGLDARHAVENALEKVRNKIIALRVNYNVRLNLLNSISVKNKNGDEVVFDMPRPFWNNHPGRKKAPSFGKLGEKSKHIISSAFGLWGDGYHSAASMVWQAIESEYGKIYENDAKMKDLILKISNNEMKYLATMFSTFYLRLVKIKPEIQLYYKNKNVDAVTWCSRIFDKNSTNYFEKSNNYPSVWFGSEFGILHNYWKNSKIDKISKDNFMYKRISDDLKMLYAIRNRMVHCGDRLGSNRFAEYYARLGFELLADDIR